MTHRFVFDPAKSEINLAKHGIDFLQAQELWQDSDRWEVRTRSDREARWIVVGVIEGQHWSAIVTYRGELIRLISVRRSRHREVEHYESGRH